MSMGFMIAAASRNRDNRGRYSEDGNDRRMERNYDNRSDGNYGNYSRMDDDNEMRRRRDSRGRYMEDEGSRMEYQEGNYSRMENEPEMRRRRDSRGRYMEGETSARYMPWPEPHTPPYLDEPGMRNDSNTRNVGGRTNESPSGMRDKNVVNIRDYQDKRRIGFGENTMHHGERKGGQMNEGGSFGMHSGEKLTRDKAEKWVRRMYGDDPRSRGEMWTFEDAKKLAEERDLPTDGQEMIDYYVALNMAYNDYSKVAKEHGVDTEDYYADLAQAWLYDRDGKPPTEKLMAYHKYVVPHGEE